jgi:hypothetical protein
VKTVSFKNKLIITALKVTSLLFISEVVGQIFGCIRFGFEITGKKR